MLYGVDVSHWQPKVDWAVLKSNGVDFAIIKATQGNYKVDDMCRTHASGANKAGLTVGLYHWCDPLVDASVQAKYFIDNTKGITFGFVCADVEQYWADWNEWGQGRVTRFLAPDKISQNAKDILAYWDTNLKIKTVLYTRASFISSFSKPMLNWVSKYPLWLAHYPYNSERIKTTWALFKSQYKPSISKPNMPAGCTNWTFWQFTGDKFILPGVNTTLDINYFNGDAAALKNFSNVTAPTLTLEERVAKLEEQARLKGWPV